MQFMLELIFGLFNLKSKKPSDYNDFINSLIILVAAFGILIIILWICTTLGHLI